MNEKLKSLFENLGKPTLRGVRKCPRCGTYNGTRGLSCKNKSCGVVFKDGKEKKKNRSTDAVKINTGVTQNIYSVKIKDRGPDIRGFVQLPVIQGLEHLDAAPEIALITQTAAQCYIETCHKSEDDFSELTLNVNPCQHINSAFSCFTDSQCLTIKNSVMNSLSVSNALKHELRLLATEANGPLVQRISKNVMVVKCKPDQKNPLGFLHVSFFNHHKGKSGPNVVCSCKHVPDVPIKGPKSVHRKTADPCIHIFACICAFASEDKLIEEFHRLISLYVPSISEKLVLKGEGNELKRQENSAHTDSENAVRETVNIACITESSPPAKRKKDELLSHSASQTCQENGSRTAKSRSFKKCGNITSNKKAGSLTVEESTVNFSFQSWLASVTERINQTMHFQFSGKPEPLVFHVPQTFFDCLQQRISAGSKKKRLPNSTVSFSRKDSIPLGTFSKYTWHITNIFHVKQIFDTPQVPLEITRSFVENRDGTYDLYNSHSEEVEELAENFKKTNNLLIKPLELKTFLKVGNMAPDQKEPTPFIVEWIPNILPKSSIGELRIKFEYGHQRNGHLENCVSSTSIVHIQP